MKKKNYQNFYDAIKVDKTLEDTLLALPQRKSKSKVLTKVAFACVVVCMIIAGVFASNILKSDEDVTANPVNKKPSIAKRIKNGEIVSYIKSDEFLKNTVIGGMGVSEPIELTNYAYANKDGAITELPVYENQYFDKQASTFEMKYIIWKTEKIVAQVVGREDIHFKVDIDTNNQISIWFESDELETLAPSNKEAIEIAKEIIEKVTGKKQEYERSSEEIYVSSFYVYKFHSKDTQHYEEELNENVLDYSTRDINFPENTMNMHITIANESSRKNIGEHKLISYDEAYQHLMKGNYFSFVLDGPQFNSTKEYNWDYKIRDETITDCRLVYLKGSSSEKYQIPYYEFIIDQNAYPTSEDTIEPSWYVKCYIPAIDAGYFVGDWTKYN
ncbi:hypothetical protein EDD63_13517 [Breznakia blatticola]|uniref:Uncharacterized protein n=1 Tax=Breznakia blatticola TaxID=1754012 RepID=A0A4R7ZBX6_9FIRM|nr:hypothetical protein [Breznakia blatticola]TDW14672.1 hypothetical protein EDD63_13517 [Breznakia blatticola]